MLDMAMVAHCSPNMHPAVVQAIVKTESGFNPFAIGVNRGGHRLAKQPNNFSEAVQISKELLARGANIDLGLGQINSANLNWLGLSVEQAFNPCHNLKALQYVYLHCHAKAGTSGLGTRMQRALSCYNTGNHRKGFVNGYVAKTTKNFNDVVNGFSHIQPVSIHDVKNTSRNAVEPRKSDLYTELPYQAQNASMGVPVRSSDGYFNIPLNPENIQADNTPTRVYNSWDIFRDF